MAAEKNAPPVSANRQAYHDYFIHETYECGIALTGTEVKSIRAGRVNLRDSFARVQKGEVFLWNAHISPYEQGNIFNHDPLRTRKLLLHILLFRLRRAWLLLQLLQNWCKAA